MTGDRRLNPEEEGRRRLAAAHRLKRRSEFQRVYDNGTKVHGRFMTLFTLPNALDYSRMGVAATRKIGGAVVRNRAKRRAREMFRLGAVPAGLDLVIVARRALAEAPWGEVLGDFQSLMTRHRRRGRKP